ncbi:MAG: glycosyltransferase family 4 protein [Rubrivivax sp.]|nr:glycosyltransferase family 4 protein [Rubrivivax sp.]
MTPSLHVCIAGPIASADLSHRLHGGAPAWPGLAAGYPGAPLVAVLADELLRQGHRVLALTVDYTLPPGSPPQRAEGERLVLTIVPGRRHAWRYAGGRPGRALDRFADERRALVDAIETATPDVVHAHWTYEFALAALHGGVPHVITAHDAPARVLRHARSAYRAMRWLMARQVLRRARALTAVSAHVARELQPQARVPLAVVPNPVAPGALALGRVRRAARAAQVAMVGHGWSALKNPRAALLAHARLRQRLPRAELHLYGIDYERDGVATRRAADAGLDTRGVHWHGPLPHGELLQALNAHDVLVHPALEESFGVVIAEAMALGLPVVAGAASGGVPEVAGPQQWLVDVRSPEAIADALHDALTDPARYEAASRAGLERVRDRCAPEVVAAAYVAQYRRAIDATAWPA